MTKRLRIQTLALQFMGIANIFELPAPVKAETVTHKVVFQHSDGKRDHDTAVGCHSLAEAYFTCERLNAIEDGTDGEYVIELSDLPRKSEKECNDRI
jgi:hypothetical protein